MKFAFYIFSLSLWAMLSACTKNTPKTPPPSPPPSESKTAPVATVNHVESLAKLFEQADGIHREAWWVVAQNRAPAGKSPFGKVQRALLSSMNIKLSNKSLFRCDRYVVKKDVLGTQGFPLKIEVAEKCSEKIAAKKIAEFYATSLSQIEVTFFPDGLEELLGLGPTVFNRSIKCQLSGDERAQLQSMKCKDWAQDRSSDHMVLLDVYDYEKQGKNLIKLRGKIYENLSDIRKFEADVPLEGKIKVTETELYPPEPEPTIAVTPTPTGTPQAATTSTEAPKPYILVPPQAPNVQSPEDWGPELGIPAPRVDLPQLPPQDPNLDLTVPLDPESLMIQQQVPPADMGVEFIPLEDEHGR